MDSSRAIIAVVLSLLVLVVFQYFFVPPPKDGNLTISDNASLSSSQVETDRTKQAGSAAPAEAQPVVVPSLEPGFVPRDIVVETDLYKAILTENGTGFKSFLLKNYSKGLDGDSGLVDLVNVASPRLPLTLVAGSDPASMGILRGKADRESVTLTAPGDTGSVSFTVPLKGGGVAVKTLVFHQGSYWMECSLSLKGVVDPTLRLAMFNRPYEASTRYIFSGLSYFGTGGLEEVDLDDPGDTATFTGDLQWMGFGDNYFMTSLVPLSPSGQWNIYARKLSGDGTTFSSLFPASGGMKEVKLGLYFGPKQIDLLKSLDHNLPKAINFGWFDPIAKPLLYFLKLCYKVVPNYGLAIILITVLIKIAFWPLAHKGAKSMKTMQKLQPKLAKLKEKYGDDKERLNRELMQLYKAYRVNPMSGCLPMLLQIPVFFALYKVLLQAIELRHAPFMWWINDLSAPDRLMIPGITLPYLGGIPVLTLLMGVSMYFQQKMSPSSLDPTQAKMMQFLPVIFTFMFINFPSGLVLYWLVNNILSIVQQYYVNKFTD